MTNINPQYRYMKKLMLIAALAMALWSPADAQNPLLQKRYKTPYEIPPFEILTIDNFREGMLKGMEAHKKEIQAIVDCPDEPNFENVIVALDKAGKDLDKAGKDLDAQLKDATKALEGLGK